MAEMPSITASAYVSNALDHRVLGGAVDRRMGQAFFDPEAQLKKVLGGLPGVPNFPQPKESNMTTARIVKVFIADSNENLPLEKRVLYSGDEKLTDLTDQELFFDVPIADLLAKHNEVRKATVDKAQAEKFGRDIFLEPARIRDLKMVVVTVAQFETAMLRRTPIKSRQRREWEARQASRAEREPKPLHKLERPGVYAGGTTGSVEKENVLASAAYENAVRALGYCVRCGWVGRPQFCHRDAGKGIAIKTDVREGWAGCDACHALLGGHKGGGRMPKEQRRAEEDRLAAITRAKVLALGLWPKRLPKWEEA